MTRVLRQRLFAFNAVSALLMAAQLIVKCHDVCAQVHADRSENNAKALGQVRHISMANQNTDDDPSVRLISRNKRSSDDSEGLKVTDDGSTGDNWTSDDSPRESDEKRKWEKNKVRVWGKRGDVGQQRSFAELEDSDALSGKDGTKRSWSKNTVRVWGKRNYDDDRFNGLYNEDEAEGASTSDKRKWSDNRVRVWGKRRFDGERLSKSLSAAAFDTGRQENSVTKHTTEHQRGRNLTTGESRDSKQHGPWVSESYDDNHNENSGYLADDVEQQRAAIVKRAIDESGSRLAWFPGERSIRPRLLGYSSSSSRYGDRWPAVEKRADSGSYGGAGRYPFYSADGPKRSWRTNVIRVWGK